MRAAATLLAALLAVGASAQPAATPAAAPHVPTPFERADVTRVAEQITCYCGCPHMQVSECFCGTADQIRAEIAAHLDAGGTPEAFIAAFVDEHRTSALAVPPREGVHLMIWVLPPVLLAAGALGLLLFGRRLAARAPAAATPPVEAGSAPSGDDADAEYREKLAALVRER